MVSRHVTVHVDSRFRLDPTQFHETRTAWLKCVVCTFPDVSSWRTMAHGNDTSWSSIRAVASTGGARNDSQSDQSDSRCRCPSSRARVGSHPGTKAFASERKAFTAKAQFWQPDPCASAHTPNHLLWQAPEAAAPDSLEQQGSDALTFGRHIHLCPRGPVLPTSLLPGPPRRKPLASPVGGFWRLDRSESPTDSHHFCIRLNQTRILPGSRFAQAKWGMAVTVAAVGFDTAPSAPAG